MKRFFIWSILLLCAMSVQAQKENQIRKGDSKRAERKFQIIVNNESSADEIVKANNQILLTTNKRNSANTKGLLGDLLKTAYGSSFVQKTTNASSNLLSLGVSYIEQALKGDRQKWMNAVQKQCHYEKTLSAERKIEDFYALPSTMGAMDPQNMKFRGFGCRHYLELKDEPGNGREVFYLFCGIRKDSVGLNSIINHSKFIVELDTLMFDPQFCNLPNDSTGSPDSKFDFNKRKDLTFKVNAVITSSWMTELTQVVNDQKIGEFTITAHITKDLLNENGVFVYDKNNPIHRNAVSVQGDCFVVPRSFTGTIDGQKYVPAWGTGQYKIDMSVVEDCKINEDYYLIKEIGHGEDVAFSQGAPGKRKWDKKIWKEEWNDMKERRKGDSFWKNAYEAIKTAYWGNSWVTTITEPLGTALYSYETQKLNSWLDLNATAATANKPAGGASSEKPTTNTTTPANAQQQPNGAPQGAPQNPGQGN